VGFSIKTAVLILVFGGVIAGAFALHRLQPQANRTCHYKNWTSPCHTSGWHVDWTDVTAGGVVIVAAVAGGLIVGNRNKRKMTASRSAAQSQRA
jgi:hypothetical protein